MTLETRLRRLAHLAETGALAPHYADRLSGEADRALRLLARDKALQDLAGLMPGSSRWETAGRLVEALERFQAVAWPRIRGNARQPRGELDRLCVAILEHGEPPCQRIVWEALRHPSAVLEPPPIERTVAMATG